MPALSLACFTPLALCAPQCDRPLAYIRPAWDYSRRRAPRARLERRIMTGHVHAMLSCLRDDRPAFSRHRSASPSSWKPSFAARHRHLASTRLASREPQFCFSQSLHVSLLIGIITSPSDVIYVSSTRAWRFDIWAGSRGSRAQTGCRVSAQPCCCGLICSSCSQTVYLPL